MANTAEHEDNTVKLRGEEYRRYLERSGVIDTLKKMLVVLYEEPEWPINPNEFLCKKLAEICDINIFEEKKEDILVMENKIKSLEQTIGDLENALKNKVSEDRDDEHVTNL